MKAVILADGLGARISEETSIRPKSMVKIGGHPMLWHIMKIYSNYGIRPGYATKPYQSEVKSRFEMLLCFKSIVSIHFCRFSE